MTVVYMPLPSLCYGRAKMRQHLVECLEGQKMIPFPSAYEKSEVCE